jgi:hypothetical protein
MQLNINLSSSRDKIREEKNIDIKQNHLSFAEFKTYNWGTVIPSKVGYHKSHSK